MDVIESEVLTLPVAPTLRYVTVQMTRDGEQTGFMKVARLLDQGMIAQAFFVTPYQDTQMFLASAMDTGWLALAVDETPPALATGKLVQINSDTTLRLDLSSHERPEEGNGLLSGSFPLSMVTQSGNLPSQAEIRILYRPNTGEPGDGIVVATTTCNADGTWQVSGLNENLKYDIVARIPGFNDVLISDVQPVTP